MEVALPVWDDRLSPVFDFARRMLVAEIENGAVVDKWYCRMSPDSVSQAARLLKMGVKVLICGAISNDLEDRIRSSGIRVIPHITGEIEEVLDAYLNDTLSDAKFRLPGGARGEVCSEKAPPPMGYK